MTVMIKTNQSGSINGLLIPLIVSVLLLVGAGVFAVWAYQGRQDYKNNVDAKIAVANAQAIKAEDSKKDAQFAEYAKQPLKTYVGPEAYGAIHVLFPRTWSGYVDESGSGDGPVNGYFYPNIVPATTDPTVTFALRVQVLNESYSDAMHVYSSFVTDNKGTVTAYALPKLPSVVGSRLDGQIQDNKQGSMIVLPLRDKTLQVWTESPQFLNDFNSNILPNLTFSP